MTPSFTLLRTRRSRCITFTNLTSKLRFYIWGVSVCLIECEDSAPQPHLSWVQHPLSPGADLEVTAKKNTHLLLMFHERELRESFRAEKHNFTT